MEYRFCGVFLLLLFVWLDGLFSATENKARLEHNSSSTDVLIDDCAEDDGPEAA